MSHKRSLAFATMLTVTLVPGIGLATDSGSGPNPYRDCGIGAALFSETSWAAVSSNVIWDLGSTAITSATASPQTCSGKQVKAARFINETYPKLVEETAAGQGEHLTTALNIMECSPKLHASATQKIRADLQRVVADPAFGGRSTLEKSETMYLIVDQAVSATCAS